MSADIDLKHETAATFAAERLLRSGAARGVSDSGASSVPTASNIQAVIALERETHRQRSFLDRITGAVTGVAGSAPFILGHLLWFAIWIGFNATARHPFDPRPFSLLTFVVSLEAIVLTGFVLMSQSRMTQLADRRAHLDLQVNLLAEQELTAILRVVSRIADGAGIDINACDPRIEHLLGKTDVKVLAEDLTRELATVHDSEIAASTGDT
jgi:uncharacterized membrane protein